MDIWNAPVFQMYYLIWNLYSKFQIFQISNILPNQIQVGTWQRETVVGSWWWTLRLFLSLFLTDWSRLVQGIAKDDVSGRPGERLLHRRNKGFDQCPFPWYFHTLVHMGEETQSSGWAASAPGVDAATGGLGGRRNRGSLLSPGRQRLGICLQGVKYP